MAGSKSDYLEAKILDLILGAQSWTPPVNLWVALSNAAYDDAATGSAMTEVSASGTAYARVEVTNDLTTFPAATGPSPTTKSNGIQINFPTATADWSTINAVYLVDASSAGNCIVGADLDSPVDVSSGSSLNIPVGTFVFQED
jgi:hypothetical protein